MRAGAGITVTALALVLAACSWSAPFGFGLLFGNTSEYQLAPAVVHAVGIVFGQTFSVGLGDIADNGDFLLTLDDPPDRLVSLIRPGGTLEFAPTCTLSAFDISDGDAAALFVPYLAVLERPGLVSQLEDPLGLLLLGSSPAASQLFGTIGTVPAAVGDTAQSRLYVDRPLRLSASCVTGNAAVEIELDLVAGWNPLRLVVDRVRSGGQVEASYHSTLGTDLVWYYWSLD